MNLHRPIFSLRLLLALVTLAALGFARFAYLERQRQQIVRDIEAVGGSVISDPLLGLGLLRGTGVTSVQMPHESTARFDLDRLKLLPNATALHLKECSFVREDVAEVTGVQARRVSFNIMRVALDRFEQSSVNSVSYGVTLQEFMSAAPSFRSSPASKRLK